MGRFEYQTTLVHPKLCNFKLPPTRESRMAGG
jgi:hypothetical protein